MAYLVERMQELRKRILSLELDAKKFQEFEGYKDKPRQTQLARKSIDICIKVLEYEIELIDNLLAEELPNYGQ